ncbi:MAG: Uma2 family endonuclease [Gemmataceae bacterium]
MATATPKQPKFDNLAELMEQLGGIPLERILMQPPPGTATEKDVLAAERQPRKRLCELIDGVLVEKAMGLRESMLAVFLAHLIHDFLGGEPTGIVLGADGMIRTFPGQVRIPDVSFISWEKLPSDEVPNQGISRIVPNLAVEVLSPGNTKAEIDRKLRDYFLAGVELVWVIDPKTQTAKSYTTPEDVQRIGKAGSLDGGSVLPGFCLPLKQLFASLHRPRRR